MTRTTRRIDAEHDGYQLVTYLPVGTSRVEHPADCRISPDLYQHERTAILVDPSCLASWALDATDLDLLVGRPYSSAILNAYDWRTAYPLVAVDATGVVGAITGIVYADDPDTAWTLIDVQDGRVRRAGTGVESDAAALRSELVAAGLLDANDAR